MGLVTIRSTSETRLTVCRYLLKRIKDLEDHVAAQAGVAITVANATGTDDGPTPASASADDLMTFSTVTNDPEASIGPDGHPADALAGSQQAKTRVPVKAMLSHVDPSVSNQQPQDDLQSSNPIHHRVSPNSPHSVAVENPLPRLLRVHSLWLDESALRGSLCEGRVWHLGRRLQSRNGGLDEAGLG